MIATTPKQQCRFKIGDWVTFRYGVGDVVAQVVEDLGPIGAKGRRLYGILISREFAEPDSFDLPEDELRPALPPTREEVIAYLKEGGLVDILRANLGGGRDQPRVWLTYKSRGGVTHTFVEARGIVGGEVVPYFALHERQVFTGKKADVLQFLRSFGLDRDDAEEVLASVGTAP